MSRRPPHLSVRERRAVETLVRHVLARSGSRLRHAALFGSKARGDANGDSDVDLLLVCAIPPELREAVGRAHTALADRVGANGGVPLEAWTVCVDDLREGRRTPMLVDAVADSIPVWPPEDTPLHAPFTPADALFCADRLLAWVNEGGAVAARALREGRPADAAARARDDIARLATAALLLTGDTRHRRVGSLRRFERRFVDTGMLPGSARAALQWAARAFPPDGDRGVERPGVPPCIARTALTGCELAAALERHVVPLVLRRMAELRGRGPHPQRKFERPASRGPSGVSNAVCRREDEKPPAT